MRVKDTHGVSEKGKRVDKSERSGMATHGMHSTTLSKPLVVHRVTWAWSVHHQEDGKSDMLDEGVESVERRGAVVCELQDKRCLYGIVGDIMGSGWTQ